MATANEIGEWLLAQIRENGRRRTYQSRVARDLRDKFGDKWLYRNHNGNPAIDRGVLREFGRLKNEFVIWDRSDQSWRVVEPDELARIQELAARRVEQKAEVARRKAEWEAAQAQQGN